MPPPSGPAVEEVLRLLPFAAAAALQRVCRWSRRRRRVVGTPRNPRGPFWPLSGVASEVRAILSSGGAPSWGGWDAKGLCRRPGASCCHAFAVSWVSQPLACVLRPGQRCSSRLRLEGGLCPLPG